MPENDPYHTSVIMHRLREYRHDQKLSQAAMRDRLAEYGCSLPRTLYASAETQPYLLHRIDLPSLRTAAAAILGVPEDKIIYYDLPFPCNYCHLAGTRQDCVGCQSTPEERMING